MQAFHYKPKFMIVAGEPSGDILAAELINALRADPKVKSFAFAPYFLGAGGSHMANAGAEIVLDLCQHAMVGLSGVIRRYLQFRRHLRYLVKVALARQPDVIIGVDFSGFNLRFAQAVRARLHKGPRFFNNWKPALIQYVSPQVWASRAGRTRIMEKNLDLVLCLFEFEKEWYSRHAPAVRIEFVGHPIVDRHRETWERFMGSEESCSPTNSPPCVVLLPGSRPEEVTRHLPIMLEASRLISAGAHRRDGQGSPFSVRARFRLVLPDERFREMAELMCKRLAPGTEISIGGLDDALATATVAIACTGTVTLECAVYGIPTVAIYKTSLVNYFVGRRLITVRHLAMPNILAGEEVFPEFIQERATPVNLARAVAVFLDDSALRNSIRKKLRTVVAKLGPPGASARAASVISNFLPFYRAEYSERERQTSHVAAA